MEASPLRVFDKAWAHAVSNFYAAVGHNSRPSMVCLFHGDYGPADPAFKLDLGSPLGGRGWIVDASLLKEARNIGEAEATQRHLIRGEAVTWCDQGYAWVEQDAIGWFYTAALLFIVMPYLIVKIKARTKRALGARTRAIDAHQRLTH